MISVIPTRYVESNNTKIQKEWKECLFDDILTGRFNTFIAVFELSTDMTETKHSDANHGIRPLLIVQMVKCFDWWLP